MNVTIITDPLDLHDFPWGEKSEYPLLMKAPNSNIASP